MSRTTAPDVFLAQGLSALAVRLEAKEAAEVAATLAEAMRKTTDPTALQSVALVLSAVSGRLEPKEAAATLTQAMSKMTDLSAWAALQQALSAVLVRLDPKEAAQVWGQAAAALIQALALLKNSDPNAWQSLAQNLSAMLARELPPQMLIDLLKHPCCVGKARRQVLDELARHGYRPFADQWDFVDYVQQQKLGLDLTTPPAHSRMLP
jgi:hypothetical protein